MSEFRIGQGMDAHRFQAGRRLIIGGIEIPAAPGLLGHSDADVLTHAVMDAILGALALGDIGQWFPDHDPDLKDADSVELLRRMIGDRRLDGWGVGNLDCVIIAEKPRLAAYIPAMRQRLAQALNAESHQISIKATTTEGMGFCGRGEGIAVMATVLMAAV